ncbi:MAG TPA: efflux RND transporter periplasmic adaptor subunit, partial [Cellvibrionaceae bacterium]|nr:efflux RND transporter periplasmic adaptor subunit [Cellvibrionaceae bacterium]
MKASAALFKKSTALLAVALMSTSGLFWFGQQSQANAANGAPPPPPSVEVVELKPTPVRSWVDFSGRLAAVESASLKPQVSGIIQKILFTEGQEVRQGQPLLVIDPRPHEAALQQAKAKLASAESQYQLARDELKRAQQLLKQKLIADSLFEASVNAEAVAAASRQEAQAAVARAQLNVEYAHISAPISGRISRAELTQGNNVEAGANAPVLARITASKTLYAEFNVDEASYIKLVRKTQVLRDMPVQVRLAAEQADAYGGHLESIDNHIDPATGTIRARAILDNAKGELTPGMFAQIRLGSAQEQPALLIPDKAVGTNQSKKFVMVVDDKNTANYREVTLGDFYDGQRVVLAGLQAGERIISNGLSKVRPNTPVT